MQKRIYTVEDLMLDDSFLRYCLDEHSPGKELWETETAGDQQAVLGEARYMIHLLYGKLDEAEVTHQVGKIKKLIANQAEKYPSVEIADESVSWQPGITRQYTNQKRPGHTRKRYAIYVLTASALIFFGAYLVRSTSLKPTPQQPQSPEVSYHNKIGERRTIELPDGSVAILNSNSFITVAGDYGQAERSILLNGEAFFRVARNPAKPFIVHTGGFSVTALGTSFFVHARNSANNDKVDLLEGKVRLAADKNKDPGTIIPETVLLPGEEGVWQPSKMSFLKTIADSTALKKWVVGKLSFKNMAVEKVLGLLRDWYGVEITVKHKRWDNLTLTGDYDNKPLDHVLKIICFSLSAGYSYSGNQVIIE
jgi:transmembrane sensor